MCPPAYTITISAAPMASGASVLPLATAEPTVKTRTKVPIASTTYLATVLGPERRATRCLDWSDLSVLLPAFAPGVIVAMHQESRKNTLMSLPLSRVSMYQSAAIGDGRHRQLLIES